MRGLLLFAIGAVVLLEACYNVGEYRLPDGGLAPHEGDPCNCNDLQTQIRDGATGNVVLECVPGEALNDGDPTTVCLGSGCCLWAAPWYATTR